VFGRGGESFFIDKISGKLATEYTPLELKEEKVITSVHNILYWIDKKNPSGKKPKKPENDNQFRLWEYPVRLWVEENNINEGGSIPEDFDDVHRPELFPSIQISSPGAGEEFGLGQKITVSVVQTKGSSLSKVNFFVGNSFLGSVKNPPFVFSFVPSGFGLSRGDIEVVAVAYDSVLNKGRASISVKIK